jgi:hypothetical protein
MSAPELPGIMPEQNPSSVAVQKGSRASQRQLHDPEANMSKTTNDRRRFQRVNIALLGRFMRENRQEYPCQVLNVLSGGIAIHAPVVCDIGEKIVVYLDALGRIEGNIVRVDQHGFALQLSVSGYKREKIANQLTWLVNKDRMSVIEDRRHDRIIPKKTNVKMTMGNGEIRDCQILDVSLGGAGVWVEHKPENGKLITLGMTPGRVVRHTEHGISIEFHEIQDPTSLERQFDCNF